MKTLRGLCLSLCLVVLGAMPATASTIELIVNRTPKAIEVYIAMPAVAMLDSFGLPHQRVLNELGKVDYDRFRYGSYEEGDEIFANVVAETEGHPLTFEAMSLTFHPNSAAPPFRTPYDALIAIAVCATPDLSTDLTLGASKAHSGYIAYTDSPNASFTLTWPQTGRAPHSVLVRDYDGTRLRATYWTTVADGSALVVEAHPSTARLAMPVLLVALAALVNLGAVWMGHASGRLRALES